ncbi:hypothetical protein niasHS_008576 [Heterodera schachtii]|uniref:MATH domain-containing protein n=1 Tax=Heterodera schachtii TaxID=97005 RepID=A0ABD2JBD1_HETSC
MLGRESSCCAWPGTLQNSLSAFVKRGICEGYCEERIWTFGAITMDIEKVSEFAEADVRSCRFSKTMALAMRNGWAFPFCVMLKKKTKIGAANVRRHFEIRIISQKNWAENSVGTLCDHVFCNKSNNWGFRNFISFEKLMDHSNGFYDREEDKVTLAIDVTVKDEKMDKFYLDQSKSNGTLFMDIENLSEFAREVIGSERKSETVHIKGFPWKIVAQINPKIVRHSNPIGRRIYNEK